jgi:hypothetical protein
MHQQMAAGIKLNTLYDRSVSIRNSVNDVKSTLPLTIALVGYPRAAGVKYIIRVYLNLIAITNGAGARNLRCRR